MQHYGLKLYYTADHKNVTVLHCRALYKKNKITIYRPKHNVLPGNSWYGRGWFCWSYLRYQRRTHKDIFGFVVQLQAYSGLGQSSAKTVRQQQLKDRRPAECRSMCNEMGEVIYL
jgi:hypothetical protein